MIQVTHKEIGKLTRVVVGAGGYDGAMIGVAFDFGGPGWGCGDFWGTWSGERSRTTKWTEAERLETLGKALLKLRDVLRAAKVRTTAELVGKPIEATFDRPGGKLVAWRILTEVL